MHLSRTELKRSLSYALACLLLAACGGAGVQHSAAPPDSELLPEGAVAFRYHRGHLYFDATVCDSIPARLVFDTGATGLSVDSLWLARSGVAPGRAARGMIGGTGVSVASMRILLEKLAFAIDTLRRESEMTPVLALKEVLGRQSDGIFGQRFLAQSCVEFNLRRGYMRAVSPDTLAAAGFACVAVEKRDDRIYLPACVRFDAGHAAEGKFLLDLGSSGAVALTSRASRRAGFDSFGGKKIAYGTVSGGIGGVSAHVCCRAETVEFGGRRLAGVPVDVSCNESGFMSRDDIAGLIGTELLERFDLVIDFGAPAVWLRPVPGADAPFPYVTPGFSLIDRTDICEGWPVTGLYEGCAPEGLRPGDVVVEWDGEPVGGMRIDSAVTATGRHRMAALRGVVRTEYTFETKEIL